MLVGLYSYILFIKQHKKNAQIIWSKNLVHKKIFRFSSRQRLVKNTNSFQLKI